MAVGELCIPSGRLEDFQRAYDLMEDTGTCVFVTGRAGTGKSTLLRYFREHTRKRVAILAPTGIPAVNISGQTIHSFFRFPPRTISREEIEVSLTPELYQALDAIVIDEVSMLRADMADNIDCFTEAQPGPVVEALRRGADDLLRRSVPAAPGVRGG